MCHLMLLALTQCRLHAFLCLVLPENMTFEFPSDYHLMAVHTAPNWLCVSDISLHKRERENFLLRSIVNMMIQYNMYK